MGLRLRLPVIWAARVWFFFQGISTSLVLSTVNGYLKSVGATTDYMGYVMAGYAFGGIVAAPIFGKIADKTKSCKIVLALSIAIQLVSYVLYFYVKNENVILLARIMAGVGFGADGAIVGEISRVDADPSTMALVTGCHEMGFFVGPILLVGISRMHFVVGREISKALVVDDHNAIGFFCAILWFVAFCINCFSRDPSDVNCDDEQKPIINFASQITLVSTDSNLLRPATVSESAIQILICIYSYFAYMVMCAILDTSVTPLTDRYFGFTDIENGILLLSCGFTSAITYWIMQLDVIKTLLPEYQMLAFSCSTQFIVAMGMAIAMHFFTFKALWIYFVEGILLFIFCTTLPFLNVACISLLSKFSPESKMSYLQGIRSSGGRIAKVLGSLWAGNTLFCFPLMMSIPSVYLFVAMFLSVSCVHLFK